jgi:shikimate dehydrogenase
MKTTDPQNYCVIGSPIGHSLSPYIMSKAFADAGVDATYRAVDVRRARLATAIDELMRHGLTGANVTFPLKEAVLSHVTRRSPATEIIGAANTLIFTPDGIEAHNTDAPGTARALQVLGGVSPADRSVLIFGAGGAARAAAYGLLDAGAARVTFGVRNPDKAAVVLVPLRAIFDSERIAVVGIDRTDAHDHDIVINATPLGMAGVTGGLPVLGRISPSQCCFDFVYNPRNTKFLRAARTGGARTVDGLALLVAQAEESFHLWTGRRFSLTDMYAAVDRHAGAMERHE